MAEPEAKPRSLISQFKNLHPFQSSVIVNIELRRSSLIFSLKWGEKSTRHYGAWGGCREDTPGGKSEPQVIVLIALNYAVKLPVSLRA